MYRQHLVVAFLLCVSNGLWAEETEAIFEKAKEALRKSQTDQSSVVPAARLFMRAAASYEAVGNMAGTQDANSFLYWCKKKMTLKDAEELNKGGETDVIKALDSTEQLAVDPNEAEMWFHRAQDFATRNPDDNLLIAVRYFEVADRFKGTELSLKAQDLSLKAQQAALSSVRKQAEVRLVKPSFPAGRQALPEAAKVTAIQRTIRDIFKTDYASTATLDVRTALARKLLEQARTEADVPTRYTLLRETIDVASKAGQVALVIQAADSLEEAFECDGIDEALLALNRINIATLPPAQAEDFTERIMALGARAQTRDQFDKLSGLATLATKVAARSADRAVIEKARVWTVQANEAAREFTVLKKHIATLQKTPDDEEANLAFGRFYVFHYGDLQRGLPALAKGSDKALKCIAEQELAAPNEALAQLGLGNAWREWGANKPDQQKFMSIDRAIFWMKKAQPQATGLERVKLEKDLRDLALAKPVHGIPPAVLTTLGLGAPLVLKQLPVIGNKGKSGPFEHKPSTGMLLIGVELSTGKDFAATVVKSIQPTYLGLEGIVKGSVFGHAQGERITLMAKPGYAIGGVTCRSGARMDRIRFTFMRVTAKGLDPRDSYDSDWVGGQGGERDLKSSGEGRFIYGIHGHAHDNLDAIGLMVRE